MMKHFLGVLLIILLLGIGAGAQTAGTSIQDIKGINLPGVTITEIQDVTAGTFTPQGKKPITNLPPFIRVALTSKPTPDSNIRIEIWLPKENWNGRLLGTGNGGGAGSISYGALASGLLRGFATANTDMGTSPGAIEMVGHPERWADFGYRSTHEMTTASKAILEVYYKRPAHHAYFFGCSTGGQQALMEAQRYPEDYNGIVAGAPANNRTHLHASFIWNLIAANPKAGGTAISQKKMAFLSKLAIRNCDGKDGSALNDNFLTDPRICKFDPKILPQCPEGSETDSCFSRAEIAALKKIYDGPVNPRTGERIYSGLPMGGTSLESTAVHLYIFNWVFGNSFDYTKFDFDRDMVKADSILGPLLNANNPDLSPMKKRGGKILMYTGTFDQLVPFEDALNYYERVIKNQNGLKQTQDFFRFFLVPGMGHCGGGPGLNDFGQGLSLNVKQDREHDLMTAMIDWVENRIPPDKIIATTFNNGDTINKIRFQRPLFPYPKFPDYIGGDTKSASSFKGKEHKRGGVAKPAQIYLK
jgi:feruloyl esterase